MSSQLNVAHNEPNSLVELLELRAELQGHKIAYTFLIDGEQQAISMTYSQLDTQARTIATTLQALDLQGERAVLLYPQGLDYIAAFFGCLYAGVIAVPAYPPKNQRTMPRLQAIIEDSQAAIILSTDAVANSARALCLAPENGINVDWLLTNQSLKSSADHWQAPVLTPESLAFLQYTSGSTGLAKGVMVSHGNLMANQAIIKDGFGHDHQSTVVGWLPLYHDMGLIGNVMQPLYTGASVVLMSPLAFLEKPVRWLQAISKYQAHTSGAPNFAFDLCVQKISVEDKAQLDLSSWQLAFNGSEPIHSATLDRFAAAFAECGFKREAFYPCYGLAEATLLVTGATKAVAPTIKAFNKAKLEQHVACTNVAHLEDYRRLVGCGVAGLHHQIRIVHPDTQAVCENGQVGEIQVSGASIAQGYWQNALATAETFITDKDDTRWLRTGDLGFIDHGELFVSGRLKDLIIIRGRNYHPHDIEHAAQAAVDCLSHGCLAAFAVSNDETEKLVLLAELKRSHLRLADYRAQFSAIRCRLVEECGVQVDEIVLLKPNAILKTTSGKIRRSACKDRYERAQLESVAIDSIRSTNLGLYSEKAQTANSKVSEQAPAAYSANSAELTLLRQTLLLAPITAAAPLLANYLTTRVAALSGLAQEQIDLSASVLSLGIDSLKATELKYVIDEFLNIDFPVVMLLLDEQSLMDIAAHALSLAKLEKVSKPLATITHIATQEMPLSIGQQALWTVCQVTAMPTIYNMAVALQIDSVCDSNALRAALQDLLNRHGQLRATFKLNDKTQTIQTLASSKPPAFTLVRCDNEADRQQKISAWLNKAFDLQNGALLRTALFSITNDNHILVFCAHHLVIDLRSMTILLQELKQLYRAEVLQQPRTLPALMTRYSDYLGWQQDYLSSPDAEQAWTYWQQQLAGELPKLELVNNKIRPLTPSYQGGAETLVINPQTLKKLRALAADNNVTLYMLLLSVFKTLLYRYSGQHDVIVGSPLHGRTKQAFADLVGYFVNPVALRSQPMGDKAFTEYLAEVRHTVLEALRHQDYPFSMLVEKLQPERISGLSPFYRTWFVLQADANAGSDAAALALGIPDIAIDWEELAVKSAALPETVAQFDLTLMMAETEQGLLASFQYARDLFDQPTIMQLMGHFQCLLEGVLANPSQCLAELPLLTAAEQHRQVVDWNATQARSSNLGLYSECSGIHQLFEQQAEKTPNAIAVVFQEQRLSYAELNSKANQLAHFLQTRGVKAESHVAVCMERSLDLVISLLAILKAGAAYLPIDPAYPLERQRYVLHDAHVKLLLTHSALLDRIACDDVDTLCLDSQHATWNSNLGLNADNSITTWNPNLGLDSSNTAYIIYTSGSTGQPKGVMVSHANVLHSTLARQHYYDQPVGCYLLLSSFAFDSSVAGIFWTLSQGGCLCLPNEQQPKDPMSLGKLIAQQHVTHLLGLPALYSAILDTVSPSKLASLNTVIVAGEACAPRIVQQHHDTLPTATLHNEYGPTEATVWSSVCTLKEPLIGNTVAIGKPISSTQIYILNPVLHPVPVGVIGEIYIGGAGITRGYLHQPTLTAEKFVPNPFNASGERLYKTGDLAYYQADGTIEFCGRADQQIKLRGYRIECGEIESCLLQHPAVKKAVVLVRDERLVAFIVAKNDAVLDATMLKIQLKTRLPEYMIPNVLVFLDTLPLNANGKVDRHALLTFESQEVSSATESVAPRDEAEEAIAQIWREILGVESLGIHDDFFELGGHSLSGVQVVARIQESFGIDVPVNVLFEAPTIAEFVDRVAEYQN
jgi:amino acid adenylation domain-containing protein